MKKILKDVRDTVITIAEIQLCIVIIAASTIANGIEKIRDNK